MLTDVPSPIDLRRMKDARAWAESAMSKRPWRTEFFATFARIIEEASAGRPCRVLELGSGPGFLAEHLLHTLPQISYVALDFSGAMHALATQRLGVQANRVQFIERSFRDPDWMQGLADFDFVVTNQAVHELRHKQYAQTLYGQVRQILRKNGVYLVCDHFCGEGGMSNAQLYMRVEEQRDALIGAGFASVNNILTKGGLVLHHAS